MLRTTYQPLVKSDQIVPVAVRCTYSLYLLATTICSSSVMKHQERNLVAAGLTIFIIFYFEHVPPVTLANKEKCLIVKKCRQFLHVNCRY